ncbi:hypothetical protein A1351_09925 [Methylosinus sp. R-45379]|jgi:hypothetical protein|uniref:PopZ family protein n=1 Tax=unclassified Methylosinus TaxID=2624500 RepID=UPI00046663F6|nr:MULTISPECIES: DUF2497 domain-containing protein [unclassified Methylosinus]OAI30208.1 hypothetical protein A1351_09925 [Methylosinus sp. R-45379]TDX64793.1 hypothetical protein EDE12_10483 [Methylosinus sp. sav-2]
MSAVNASITAPALDAERRSHEPSMEEILASIRRIIADDDALPAARRDKEKRPAEPPQREEAPLAPAPAARAPVAARPAAPAPVVAAPAPVSVPAVEPAKPADFWLRPSAAPEEEAAPAPESADQSRWSEDTAEEVVDETLDEPVVAAAEEPYVQDIADEPVEEQMIASIEPSPFEPANDDPTPLVSTDAAMSIGAHFQALAASIVISEADLIERYAQDMLRPMLKQWLDDNLPHLVERLVRAEIERVARGRR